MTHLRKELKALLNRYSGGERSENTALAEHMLACLRAYDRAWVEQQERRHGIGPVVVTQPVTSAFPTPPKPTSSAPKLTLVRKDDDE